MKKLLLFLFLLLLPTTIALAKGEFSYIIIKGPGITGELDTTSPALTQDFFAFADFTKGAIDAPADPGQGYEVTRMYVVNSKAEPFDQLIYYPYTGYVHYVGLAEGISDYDGKWYAANPTANEPFRAVLAERARFTWIPLGVLIVLLIGVYIAYRSKPAAKA